VCYIELKLSDYFLGCRVWTFLVVMLNHDLLEILNNRNVIGMRIFLGQEDESARFVGTVRQYEIDESQGVLSLFFANSRLHSVFDLLFSFYMIPEAKFDDITSNLILLNAECQEKIVKIRPGILELLRVHEPSLERKSLTEKTITYFPETIRLSQLSSGSLSVLHNSWQILNEAEVSGDCEAAANAILTIADIYERESMSINDRHGQNAGMAKTLELMSSTLKTLAPEVKRKHTSISIANHYAQLNREAS
jgi:hypothetical protein